MSIMKYKGYTARIDFDARDNIFVGRVLGVRSIVGFHGDTVAKLRADFHAAIDHMLAEAKRKGVAPEKPASGKMMLRVPSEVHAAALIAAEGAGKSLNQWATKVLAEATQTETA